MSTYLKHGAARPAMYICMHLLSNFDVFILRPIMIGNEMTKGDQEHVYACRGIYAA
jgi:hypothetical protein